MSVITIISDFGYTHYLASLKGTILCKNKKINIIDISHNISSHSKTETTYILKNCYKSFPKGTVHIIGVCSEFSEDNKAIVSEFNGHYFICGDNGILSLILEENFLKNTFLINTDKEFYNFTAKDLFVDIAIKIISGEKLKNIGGKTENLKLLTPFKPFILKDKIIGHISHIDNYGNCVTNVNREFFKKNKKGERFELSLRNQYSDLKIDKIFKNYTEKKQLAEPFLLFNSNDFLEISMYESSKEQNSCNLLLGLNLMDEIEITFI